ncbi:DUF4303 domain-containing protein [Stenotrophomonas terrae]|uniref:DUF4303 domain-containing protein n=1 Tax=Stenotrophomonas terrae TaxID=405446 RepID=UPI00320BAF82
MNDSDLYDLAHWAVRGVCNDLFSSNESFYYVTIFFTEEGFGPTLSAWSREALQREAELRSRDIGFARAVKWSYADSPYCDYHGELFSPLRDIFNLRPSIQQLGLAKWQAELSFRLGVFETALQRLDQEGFFSKNQSREQLLLAVEIMPPISDNISFVEMLNDVHSSGYLSWFDEAAEDSED